MTESEKTQAYQEAVSDRAEQLLDAEIAKGASFSEGLSNWAISQAEREVQA